jgi:hypothetical protein
MPPDGLQTAHGMPAPHSHASARWLVPRYGRSGWFSQIHPLLPQMMQVTLLRPLRDLGDVGHHALTARIERRHQRLDVGDLSLPVTHLDRPGFAYRRSAGPTPFPMRLLTAGVTAVPGIKPRPRRQGMAASAATTDRARHGFLSVTAIEADCQSVQGFMLWQKGGRLAPPIAPGPEWPRQR